jgi:transposase-like protein
MDDLAHFCCQNPACKDHGLRGANNLRVHSHCGARKQYRILVCRTCGGRFSARQGIPLFRSHLPEDKAASVLEHRAAGCGVRQTGRLVRVHRDTVMRYGRLAGEHARDAHNAHVAFSPEHRAAQCDETSVRDVCPQSQATSSMLTVVSPLRSRCANPHSTAYPTAR